MSSAAQTAANQINAQASTGPCTDEGKSRSSRNSLTHGLFALRDFIRPDEEQTYAQLDAALKADLRPVGTLELNLVEEIRGVMWRLARCRDIEAGFIETLGTGAAVTEAPGAEAIPIPQAPGAEAIKDPMQNEATARLQNSIDRARAQSHRLLHRCTSELRRLQTSRQYLNEVFPAGTALDDLGISDWQSITSSLAERMRGDLRQRKIDGLDSFESIIKTAFNDEMRSMAMPESTKAESGVFAERTQSAPRLGIFRAERTQSTAPKSVGVARNAPCPCNSGRKYKRCCGKNQGPWLTFE
jgi:hypothetical protein